MQGQLGTGAGWKDFPAVMSSNQEQEISWKLQVWHFTELSIEVKEWKVPDSRIRSN